MTVTLHPFNSRDWTRSGKEDQRGRSECGQSPPLISLKEEPAFRYDRHLDGRRGRYLNATSSAKAVKRARLKIREAASTVHEPFWIVIRKINGFLRGWKTYFSYGYPRRAYRVLNLYLLETLRRFFRRKSQRVRKPLKKGESYYHAIRRLGYVPL